MNDELALLVSDECDRLLAELRSISSNSALIKIQNEIVSLKLILFTNSFQISQILSPFEKIIIDEQTTDFITSLALSSINTFISFNLLQSTLDVDTICNTIKNCQFQSTSDFDCAAVSYRILTCIISLCRTDLLNSKTLLIMLDYIMTEIKNSDRNISPIIVDALSSISTYISKNNVNNDFLFEKLLTNLYFLCQYESCYQQCGLICLLQVSRVTKNRNDSLMAVTCSLFHKFILSIDSRDNFVLILRLFTHVFIDKYMIYPLPFSKCFLELLNFLERTNSNKNQQISNSQSQFLTLNYHLKRAALEVISDFISQPNFLLNLFVNLNGYTYFPNLFDKLIKVYFTNIDKKNNILKLNLPDIKILTNNQHNFYFSINKKEIIENINSEKDHYNELLKFSEKFNENPSYFIKNSNNFYTPHKIAINLIESPNLSRKQIGEFFGKNKPFCMETLQEYLELLDFSTLDFDSSIRLFLSGFQIAGEGQIVDRIFEHFSKRFFSCTSDKIHFKSQESVHILAYGWLMIHTSFHNNNVTKKPIFAEFKQMMENQNNGENFDEDFLNDIFESVKNVKVPFEDSEQEGSVAHWRFLLCRQRIADFKFVKFPKIEINNKDSTKQNVNQQNEKDIQIKNEVQSNENKNKIEKVTEIKAEIDENQKVRITNENQTKIITNGTKEENENYDENHTTSIKKENEKDDENQTKHTQKESENQITSIRNDDENKEDNESEINNECLNQNKIENIKQNDEINDSNKKNKIDIQIEIGDDFYFLFEDENQNENNAKEQEEAEKKIEKDNATDEDELDSILEEISNSINESEKVNDDSLNTTDSEITNKENNNSNESTENNTNNFIIKQNTNDSTEQQNETLLQERNINLTMNNKSSIQLENSENNSTFIFKTNEEDDTDYVPLFVIEKEMFQRIWNLEKSKIIDLCIINSQIFHSTCLSASKFGMTDVVDSFVMLFSKNSVEELLEKNGKEHKKEKKEERNSNLFLLGSIVTNYGHSIRNDGWTSYIKFLTTLLELDLLNDDILTFKNIAEDMKPVVLCHKLVNARKSRRNSMFSLFLSRRPSFDDLNRPITHSNLREFVSKSGIEKFIENDSSEDSLFSLVSAIITVSQEVQSGFETDQMRIAFCVILIEKVVTEKKNLASFLKNKKVFEKITDDFFVSILSKKSGSFLSTLFFNEAFVIVLDLWEINQLQVDLLYFIDKVFVSPQICQNEVQVDMIEKCLSLFFEKHFQSFISMQHLRGILNLIQIGILQDSKKSFLLLQKFEEIQTGDFENVRFPLIQVKAAVILVENQKLNSSTDKSNSEKRKTFSDMKPLIFVKDTTDKQWENFFNDILFPLTMKRIRYDDLIILILETFEFAVNKLCQLPLFESIWFRVLSLTLDFSRRCDADVKSQIETRLSGCIQQMKKLSIFKNENSKIWNLTKSNVDRVFPSII